MFFELFTEFISLWSKCNALRTLPGLFFHTKIRSYLLAAKIFKNTEDIGMGYIWCCCHISFRHRQINVQNIAANVWHCGSFLSISLPLILRLRVAPNNFLCSPNYCRCSSNCLSNLSPYGRNVMLFELFPEYFFIQKYARIHSLQKYSKITGAIWH